MKNKNMTIKDINPGEYYSSAAVVKMGLLPWKSAYTFNKKLNDEKWQDWFLPLVEQHDTTKTYKIRGENIIRFLNALQRGEVEL